MNVNVVLMGKGECIDNPSQSAVISASYISGDSLKPDLEPDVQSLCAHDDSGLQLISVHALFIPFSKCDEYLLVLAL